MTDTTIVHLLRHGEVHNPEGVLYGRLPGYRLSEDGVLMAKAAAKWFADRDVTALFSSPMQRALETAAPPKNREVEATKARERSRARYAYNS